MNAKDSDKKNCLQSSGDVIEIEIIADKIYYTIIGKQEDMNSLLDKIKMADDKRHGVKYIVSKLMVPLACVSFDTDKPFELAEFSEHVQCSVICDCNKREEKVMYCLLCVDESNGKCILRFPEIELNDSIEPDKIIIADVMRIAKHVPPQVKDTLRLIDVTGPSSDILVYCARLTSSKKYKQTC